MSRISTLCLAILVLSCSRLPAAGPQLELQTRDRIAVIGNTLAERMQHDGWLETLLQSYFPTHEFSFRNLGFAGDEVKRDHARPASVAPTSG